MRTTIWLIGLMLVLFGSSSFAKGNSDKAGKGGKKKQECVRPAPKYGGQCDKGNQGHGNNKDGVDKSNPGKSKQGEDTDPDVDDETKPGK